mgnify:FL=1
MKKKNPAANHRRIVELDQVVGVKVPLLSQVPARLVKIGCDGQFWNMYLNAVTLEISQLLMAEGFANFVQPLNIYLIVVTLPVFHLASGLKSTILLHLLNIPFIFTTFSVFQFVNGVRFTRLVHS